MNHPSPIIEKNVTSIAGEIFKLKFENAVHSKKQESDSIFGDLQKTKLPETNSADIAGH